MATNAQRAQAICDAIINGTATQAQMNRIASAMLALDGRDPSASTLAQKAESLVASLRSYCLQAVKRHEGEVAAQAARLSNAATVESGFVEAP